MIARRAYQTMKWSAARRYEIGRAGEILLSSTIYRQKILKVLAAARVKDPTVDGDLQRVFAYYARSFSHGRQSSDGLSLEQQRFQHFCRECLMMASDGIDARITFTRHQQARVITYRSYLEILQERADVTTAGITEYAGLKKPSDARLVKYLMERFVITEKVKQILSHSGDDYTQEQMYVVKITIIIQV